jgi:hypothetical protein
MVNLTSCFHVVESSNNRGSKGLTGNQLHPVIQIDFGVNSYVRQGGRSDDDIGRGGKVHEEKQNGVCF